MPHKIRAAVAQSKSDIPFFYQDEPFFDAYAAIEKIWIKRKSQKKIAQSLNIGRDKIKQWELNFSNYGTIGLLPQLSHVKVDPKLEKLVVLIKASRPHESASLALRLAQALEIPGASLEIIRQIQRCYGYGHNLDERDIGYFYTLQHILSSVIYHKEKKKQEPVQHQHQQPQQQHYHYHYHYHQPLHVHDKKRPAETFINFDSDHLQHKVELFKTLSQCQKKRQVRPELRRFGVHPNRFYLLKQRYLLYGVWGLVDLVQNTKQGEKISHELELMIIEQRLMDPKLSTGNMIKKLRLKCSQANVQKIYNRWGLAKINQQVMLRGVISQPPPQKQDIEDIDIEQESVLSTRKKSAKSLFPDLIQKANLKVDRLFLDLLKSLSYRSVSVSNPGAIIIAAFLDQLGVVEALHTYGPGPGPLTYRGTKITNDIIVNTLRIIAGFPTINDFSQNSDRSVAIGAGLSLNPKKSRYYDSFDQLRFHHLQKLRNDASSRARELGIIEGKEIAVDYHCSPSYSRFPADKSITKSPDKNQNFIYAHRPQIIWDSITNSIINIAYCEGSSRAPSALYQFCEENLFKIIDADAIAEIYADSEYTGEKQLMYLTIRSQSDITMCLKQNPKIKRWKEETIRKQQWQNYEDNYQIVSQDYILAETGKPFRFVVKRNIETNEVRCFGSTHVDYSPAKILNLYHIRWPVESGLKDLVENYYLDKATGTSPEKVEVHYYCVMLARLAIDYFLSVLGEQKWKGPQDWECVLSTIRTSIFSNQNCQLSVNEDGDMEITFLDGDQLGIINNMAQMMEKRRKMGINKVSWWGNRALRIKVKDQYKF